MNINFKNEIIRRIKQNENLFYNSSGNVEAFKLYVRHLSYAPNINEGKRIGNIIIPNNTLILVDFDEEIIYEIDSEIKLIDLKNLK